MLLDGIQIFLIVIGLLIFTGIVTIVTISLGIGVIVFDNTFISSNNKK